MFKTFSLSKNKKLDIVCGKPHRFIRYFDISSQWTREIDYAGFSLNCSLLDLFFITIDIYDIRNWNDEKKCFEFNWNNR